MAPHSSRLAWRILGSQRVGQDWASFTFTFNIVGGFPFLHTLSSIYCLYILTVVILTCLRWYLIVVLTCISLIINDLEPLFMCCWPSIYLLWRNVYLGLLPIFWLGCLLFCYLSAWAVCRFWRLIPCQLLHLQIFSPILSVSFSSCLWFPLLCKSF